MSATALRDAADSSPARPVSTLRPYEPDPALRGPDLSVIVVTHNRPELALTTLESARAAASGLDVQWLVIDSGSDDETPDAIERRFADMDVSRYANIGFAAANNKALELVDGRYFLLLNPDVEVVSGSFAELVAAMDAQPSVGIASVIQQDADAQLHLSIRRYPSVRTALGEALGLSRGRWREEESADARYREERPADWLVGAFLIARAETVEQIGGLDERFFLYSEETDWCYRAKDAGWEVRHLPQMVIIHHCVPSTKPDLVAQLSYAKLLFARKHYARWRAITIQAALAIRHALRTIGLAARSVRSPVHQPRLAAERRALAVILGIAQPPFR